MASLYICFKQQQEFGEIKTTENSVADMFCRKNYKHLEQAIIDCSYENNKTESPSLKHDLKTALYYLIKKSCKVLKGTYLVEDL